MTRCLKRSLLRGPSLSTSRYLLFSLLLDFSCLRFAFSFFSFTTTKLVGRVFRPGRSTTPESHRPAVVTGLYADWVLRALGSIDAGEGGQSSAGGSSILIGARFGTGASDGESGSTSSLIRNNSMLRLLCLSSSVSGRAWSSSASPKRFRVLPVLGLKSALPVELERPERDLIRGDAVGEV